MSTVKGRIGAAVDAIAELEELVDVTGGRVDAVFFWAQEWASLDATRLSYELFAREFMPIFKGTTKPLRASRETVGSTSDELLERQMEGAMKFIVEHSDN